MAVRKPEHEGKTYGLMGVIRDTGPKVEKLDREVEEVHTWPHLFFIELLAFMTLLLVLIVLSLFFDAPLEELANPAVTPGVAKAPWYFAGLQELLSYFHPVIAGILVPGSAVVALLLVPYLDRNPRRQLKYRKAGVIVFTLAATAAVLLTIIGTFFRGAGWAFVLPWE